MNGAASDGRLPRMASVSSMDRTRAALALTAVFLATTGCGNTQSNAPQEPAGTGGRGGATGGEAAGGGGAGTGAAGGGEAGTGAAGGGGAGAGAAGGGGGARVIECKPGVGDNPYNPPHERLQFKGTNGSFEDHCDDMGHLVQYRCATKIICTPTPETPCVPDATVPYESGEVSEATFDCVCVNGTCPPP
jgi:hypothetical protein